ncbi:MAG TPA: ClpXP protease specificity-enhancing factor SspB [Caulobacteraceae bacterium]|nr:ClpXP protease specificity-enhancing factor SspB [Caulobacteraceae bacterium]
MAKDEPRDLIGYEALQQEALRGVIRAALATAAGPNGLPGEHHFYISFRTQAPGVAIPEELRSRYPEDMTIVLQNQFWDLNPGVDAFSVTLQFSGQPKSLFIPYAAITRFYDPSVRYMLQFASAEALAPAAAPAAARAPGPAPTVKPEPRPAAEPGAKVVALDQFRRK